MTTSPQQPPPGLTVGGYELLTRLGEGGMGVVHLARPRRGERVALKVIRPHVVGDDEARERLAREVSSLSRIRSPWVAEIVDSDPWGEIPFVATRYVPGPSLHDLVKDEGPLNDADLRFLAHGLAEGIASVHAVGVLHRDVKPSNVLIEGRTPILIDFGLARVADDPKLTHTGWLLGTPGYLAPEILDGYDATARSDVHSWGATVAFAGTGRSPFGRGPSMAITDRVRRGQHDLDGLPDDLRRIVAAALDPDPRRRPGLDEVLEWLDGGGPPPEEPDDPYTVPLALAAQGREHTLSLFEEEDEATPTPYEEPEWAAPPRPGALERLRRGMLWTVLAVAAGAALTAYPWVALPTLLVLTWLLRSASLAATATGDRRRLRGAKWYDPVLYLVGAPWHVVRAIPGTLLLALWSLGLALAAVLICYAAAADLETSLFVTGLTYAGALALGPGGSRVRSPLARAVHPLAARPGSWLVALVVVGTLAAAFGYLVSTSGVNWSPFSGPPYPVESGIPVL
ncbi:serine/threonine-protein kinase [Nocardioides sp.]|uniref:serine/threonine-protein kinase n=1 Tax=Nocardioides sp. TaxID=35761 RepID=UPI002D7FC80D|nr:serine/threonine-protein kinase [Nocardioides sp.]HET8960566.1 serine/threonine-protein kinase [Nocardioides sp.]